MAEEVSEITGLLPADASEVFESTTCCQGGFCHLVDSCAGKLPQDDVVSLGVKQLSFTFCITICFWLVTYVAIMVHIGMKEPVYSEDFLMFGPMWLGTLIGLVGTVFVSHSVCMNATLVSADHRQYMREQGLEQDAKFVDYDSLPLMRRLLCWNVGLFVSFLLVLVSQILFSLWFIYGLIGLWHALIPMLILTTGYLIYLYVMNVVSVVCCVIVTLAVVEMVLIVVKCNGQLSGWSWSLVCLPLGVVLPTSMSYTAYILAQHMRGLYILSKVQVWSAVGYVLCLGCLYGAFGITLVHEYMVGVPLLPVSDQFDSTSNPDDIIGNAQYALCSIAVVLFSVSVMLTLRSEGLLVANSRGYTDPVPLSHSKDGWVHTPGAGVVYTILLGTISTKLSRGPSQSITSPDMLRAASTSTPTRTNRNSTLSPPMTYGSTGTYSSPGLRVNGDGGIELLPCSTTTSPV